MRRLLTVLACAFVFSGGSMAVEAPRAETPLEWKICQRTLTQPPQLRYERIVESTGAAIQNKDRDAMVIAKLRETVDSTLAGADRNDPDVAEFLRRVHAWAVDGLLQGATWRIKPGSTPENFVLFDRDDDPHPILWNCRDQRWSANLLNIAYLSNLLDKAQSVQDNEKVKLLDTAVLKLAREYDNLLENGFSMWPWEMVLNGLRLAPRDSSHPFTTQFVIFRPSAALEVNTRSRADANLEASLLVEPIGFVRYTSTEYNHWWGASLAVTSSTRDGMGYGALIRYDNYTLGVMRHKSSTAGEPDSNFVMLSMDLYNLLDSRRANINEFAGRLKDNACRFYQEKACAQP
jgi:hypothetical protein